MSVLTLILAGGAGSRLSVLGEKRAKPAVPFGGKYRIIDFALSNAANSDLHRIAVLTQYRPYSLMQHIGIGEPWDRNRRELQDRKWEILAAASGDQLHVFVPNTAVEHRVTRDISRWADESRAEVVLRVCTISIWQRQQTYPPWTTEHVFRSAPQCQHR